jgi:hypothetical protein
MTAGDACPRLSGTRRQALLLARLARLAGLALPPTTIAPACGFLYAVRRAQVASSYLDCTSTPPRHPPTHLDTHLVPPTHPLHSRHHHPSCRATRGGPCAPCALCPSWGPWPSPHGPRPTASTRPPLASPLVTSRCERDTLSDSERLFLFRHCPIQPMGGMCHATLLHGCILPLLCIAPENRCQPKSSNPVLSRFVCCFRCCTPTSACPSPVQSGS